MLGYAQVNGLDLGVPLIVGNALIDAARSAALGRLRSDSAFVFFVDDDMLPEKTALLEMVEQDLPVLSAVCTNRAMPVYLVTKVYDPAADQFAPIELIRQDRVLTGQFGIGCAFLLMKREVVDLLIEDYLSATDWLEENRRTFDRLHVRNDLRQAEQARKSEIRRANWAQDRYLDVFARPAGPDERRLGEDMGLSRRLIRLGVPISLDPRLAVAHMGEYPYGYWDVLQQFEKPGRSLTAL